MFGRMRRVSLLWRVLLATSIAATLLFAGTAWLAIQSAIHVTEQSVDAEIHSSLGEYEFLWRTRAESLAKISVLMSTMSDVRAAFQTGDGATIRDTAADLWARVSQEDAVFLVFDPRGRELASLGGRLRDSGRIPEILPAAMKRFPKQAAGFLGVGNRLYYMLLTPVYVQTPQGPALLNILVAAFEVNDRLAASLERATPGSDFVFLSGGRVAASTLDRSVLPEGAALPGSFGQLEHIRLGGNEYATLSSPLFDIEGRRIAELRVMRSLASSDERIRQLRRNVAVLWTAAVILALVLTTLLARRMIEPVRRLDRAASEIARGHYDYRLRVDREDELGRLAKTFNSMCDSIQAARDELISQERLNTIGRLSSSIIHDLRNPLAAIYGGAEMLADHEDMPRAQSRRLALNIYRASRRIQELLQDLAGRARGRDEAMEICRLRDIVEAAHEAILAAAEAQGVEVEIEVPAEMELPLERSRMERVFLNVMSNSVEAMPEGGRLRIGAARRGANIVVEIDDTGTGISEDLRKHLFRPFVTAGKRSGLGLGLALSRQTVVDHGGDIWTEPKSGPGARFLIQLPCEPAASRSPVKA